MKVQDTPSAFEPSPESIETDRRATLGRGSLCCSGSRVYSGLLAMLVLMLALALIPGAARNARADSQFGYEGPVYGEQGATGFEDIPTTGGSQSKLWFNDGSWWGLLYNPTAGGYRIHRLAIPDQTWNDTGIMVDTRRSSYADVLWDGSHLYIASAVYPGKGGADLNANLLRFSYNAVNKSYSLDSGFPVVLAQVEMEAIVLDKDSTGMLWVTYTAANGQGGWSVFVSHSTGSDTAWRTPYVLPATGTSDLGSLDSSAIIAYDNKIGVMWSSQPASTILFASHQDGAPDNQWAVSTAFRPNTPDPNRVWNQISLKAVSGNSYGRVFAALGSWGTGPALLVLNGNESWEFYSVPSSNGGTTLGYGPILVINDEQRKLYVFAADDFGWYSGGVNYTETSLDTMNFGLPASFIAMGGDLFLTAMPTSKKGSVNGASGLAVLAGDLAPNGPLHYRHNTIGLPGPVPTATSVPPTATPLPTSPPASGELLTNGSFENGSAGWTLSAQARVSAEAAYEGSYGVRFAGKTASAIARQDLAVPSSGTLTFRAAGRVVAANNSTGAGIVEFKVYDGSGTQLGYWRFDTLTGASSDWRVFTGNVTVPGNTKKARVQVRVVNLDGTMDFDAFSLRAEGTAQAAVVEPAAAPSTETALAPAETEVPPTATEAPPAETPVPPTAVNPAETAVPPTETAVPPTSAPSEPTATAAPPTDTAVPATLTAAPTAGPTATPRGWGRGGRPG